MGKDESLIPEHGGYRKLKTFQLAQLAYDLTVRFCDLNIDPRSRTRDQMIQAARSGTQNIAEGSRASGTSKKMELKLTNVARASLEELRLDYEDYLRQRDLPQWPPEPPALKRFKAKRCATLEDIRAWIAEEKSLMGPHGPTRTHTDPHGQDRGSGTSVSVRVGPCESVPTTALVANAALSLINLCCHLLDRQLKAQAKAFEQESGFTERLHRMRRGRRDR